MGIGFFLSRLENAGHRGDAIRLAGKVCNHSIRHSLRLALEDARETHVGAAFERTKIFTGWMSLSDSLAMKDRQIVSRAIVHACRDQAASPGVA